MKRFQKFNHTIIRNVNVCEGFNKKIVSKFIDEHNMDNWVYAYYYLGDVRFSKSKKYVICHGGMDTIRINRVTFKFKK